VAVAVGEWQRSARALLHSALCTALYSALCDMQYGQWAVAVCVPSCVVCAWVWVWVRVGAGALALAL
jgi:hypothetical protein